MRDDKLPDPEPIGQSGMDARREPIGQADLAQHDTEVQHEFARRLKASGKMACAHQRVSATSRNQAFCCRSIVLSYHGQGSRGEMGAGSLFHIPHHVNTEGDGEQGPEGGAQASFQPARIGQQFGARQAESDQ